VLCFLRPETSGSPSGPDPAARRWCADSAGSEVGVRAAGPSGATVEGMMHAPRRANLQMPLRDQVPLIGWSRPSTALPSEVACPRRAPLGACVADVGRCLVGHGGGVTLSSGGVSEFPRSGWPYLGDLRERSRAAGASPPRTLEAGVWVMPSVGNARVGSRLVRVGSINKGRIHSN